MKLLIAFAGAVGMGLLILMMYLFLESKGAV